MDKDSTHYENDNFEEFNDVLKVLDKMKERVSETSIANILSFAKAYRVIQLGSSRQAEMIIN